MKKIIFIILCGVVIKAFAVSNIVNVYNWSGYIPPKVLRKFQQETGIKLNYSNFDSNEDLYAKLKAAPTSGYDVVFPSTSFVQHMAREGMIRKLDKSCIRGMQNLNPQLLNQAYDPHNRYSVPFLWGTTGILLNTKYYTMQEIKSWYDFWQPQLHNRLSMLDDMRDVFAIALKVLGYSINDQNPQHIKQAYLKLKTLLPNIQSFAADGAEHLYINENANLGMIESGDAYSVMQENNNFRYVYPRDGAIIWMDCMVIPIGAKHLQNAYRFINFILRPDVAAMISEGVGFSSPNLAAIKLMPKAIQQNRVLNPTVADLKHAEFENAISQKARKLYLHYWEMLKLGV